MYRILFFLIGLLTLTFGISLTIVSSLGSGAWDALNVGLSASIGLTTGTWLVIIGVILILLNGYLLKKRPDVGAIITLFLTGVFIDFWLLQVFDQVVIQGFLSKLLIFLIGVLGIGLGISIYIQARFPLSPIDNFMMALRARFGFNLMVAKTVGELTALILAFIFGGPIGLGTLIVTFAVGPMIQLFSPHFEQLLTRLSATGT